MKKCFVRKMHACSLSRDSGTYLISLLELVENAEDGPTEFLLHRKLLSSSTESGEEIAHIICFRARTAQDAFRRFFCPGAGVRKDFPGIKDVRWRNEAHWLHEAVASERSGDWIKVNRPGSASRPRPRRPKEDRRGGVMSTWEIGKGARP